MKVKFNFLMLIVLLSFSNFLNSQTLEQIMQAEEKPEEERENKLSNITEDDNFLKELLSKKPEPKKEASSVTTQNIPAAKQAQVIQKPIDETPYKLLGLKTNATSFEIIGVAPTASTKELRNAYQKLMEKWKTPTDKTKKKEFDSVKKLIKDSYESILLGEASKTPIGAKIVLDKLQKLFSTELPNINLELKKVLTSAEKDVKNAKAEQEKISKAAQSRAAKYEKEQPRSYGGKGYNDYGSSYDSYSPRSRGGYSSGGYSYSSGGGYGGYSPSYYGGGDYGGYGDSGYGGGYDGGYGGGGFGESGFGEGGEGFGGESGAEKEAGIETIGGGESKKSKEQKSKDESSETLKEKNIKQKIIEKVDKIKSGDDIDAINEVNNLIDMLSEVELSLKGSRKDKKEWKDLDKKYKAALTKFRNLSSSTIPGISGTESIQTPSFHETPDRIKESENIENFEEDLEEQESPTLDETISQSQGLKQLVQTNTESSDKLISQVNTAIESSKKTLASAKSKTQLEAIVNTLAINQVSIQKQLIEIEKLRKVAEVFNKNVNKFLISNPELTRQDKDIKSVETIQEDAKLKLRRKEKALKDQNEAIQSIFKEVSEKSKII